MPDISDTLRIAHEIGCSAILAAIILYIIRLRK